MINELEIKIGGITYELEIDVDEECVVGVFSVAIWDTKNRKEIDVPMSGEELQEFFERYQDELNEAYTDEKAARAQLAAEERLERENDR